MSVILVVVSGVLARKTKSTPSPNPKSEVVQQYVQINHIQTQDLFCNINCQNSTCLVNKHQFPENYEL